MPRVSQAVLLSIGLLGALFSRDVLAQSITIPDDPEHRELYMAFFDEFARANAVAAAGDHDEAIGRLQSLYADVELLDASAAAQVSMSLGLLFLREGEQDEGIEWLSRAIELGQAAEGDEGITGALSRGRLAFELEKQERWEEAARVMAVPPEGASGAVLGQAWAAAHSAGHNFARAGLYPEAREQFLIAERASVLAGDDPNESFQLRRASIHEGSGFGPGFMNETVERQRELLAMSLELFNDPYYRDVPDRLNMAGLPITDIASVTLGDYEMVEAIATEIMHEAARMESLLGREALEKALVPQAYIIASQNLSGVYASQGDVMLALEVLESAARTYPDHHLVKGEMVLGQIDAMRALLDMPAFDPEATGPDEEGRFHFTGGPQVSDDRPVDEAIQHHNPVAPAESEGRDATAKTSRSESLTEQRSEMHTVRWAAVAIGVAFVAGVVVSRVRRIQGL